MITDLKSAKRLVRRYRRLVDRLVDEGRDYTSNEGCPFCSGYDDYKSAGETENGEIKHSRKCATHKAEELKAMEI